ncbi:MAG: sigma-54-dependent Fis family transcriptional regulator [Gemmatimonadetes bacterium]|jgi:DNA-binding NtrC family response regulator|nr:sigma-54-dependent Fis family transcriptional regulator [Gemmatimonadota bacterium]MBT5588025.1 sigma-54-dependent Fis family transcriptional regulator [Gemmatimonadota bacterium]MBT5960809.1 sigma-54-dependent Fis family transcriptional regulator [Gemmatimonadota bacterium]MBT7454607.1 sigma-54-dependent Fis family transcriptional regulator [Gemmatimonadota bacterium]MBT7597652.1 sigma-54-dependent Fis family transcriptional regulator [Gemmatimonadota bacterium]
MSAEAVSKVSKGRVLIVDDEEDIRDTLADRVEAEGFEVATASDGIRGLDKMREFDPDLVLLDLQMPRLDGLGVLARIRADEVDVSVVVISAYGTLEKVVEAMKAGADDFVPKPFDADHLRVVVTRSVERQRLRRENALLREDAGADVLPIIGGSSSVVEMMDVGKRAATSTASILLLGESGTGKEVLARAIHGWSPRRDMPFVGVNCTALHGHLLESELFGHEKGAFTGAEKLKRGRFEAARGGTLLLDEIGATQPDFQVKLLRVLQEGVFERVGGERPIEADVRIIAATNRDLEKAIDDGSFLGDLYYRLNVVAIQVPPLRDRRDDIPELARFFIRKHAHQVNRDVLDLTQPAIDALVSHDWPGNIRELENAVQRAVVLGQGEQIELEELPHHVRGGGTSAKEPIPDGYHAAMEAYQRRLIQQALQETDGNQSQAAELLGLQRTYMSRLMKTLGLR